MTRLKWYIGGATVILVLVGVFVASRSPDGLQRVASDLGFASRGSPALPDYQPKLFSSRRAAQASAGLAGVALLYGFGVLLGKTLKRRRLQPPNP